MKIVTLIHADEVTPQRWRNGGGWTRELLTEKTDTLALPTIGCSLPVSTIYQRTGL